MIAELVAAIPASITGPQAAVACTILVCLTVAAGWLLERVIS
jgi:hypothetical protein